MNSMHSLMFVSSSSVSVISSSSNCIWNLTPYRLICSRTASISSLNVTIAALIKIWLLVSTLSTRLVSNVDLGRRINLPLELNESSTGITLSKYDGFHELLRYISKPVIRSYPRNAAFIYSFILAILSSIKNP